MVKITPLSEKTIPGLVNCEIASTEKWYHYYSSTKYLESTYEDLSPVQRWFHGGPTMDETLFRRYWMELQQDLLHSYDMYVALEDNELIGFIGLFYGDDLTLGKHAYIGLLLVHPEKRRMGVAKSLIHEVKSKAKDARYESIFVYPEELHGPSGKFYCSQGFKIWKNCYSLKLQVKNYPSIENSFSLAPCSLKNDWRFTFSWKSNSIKAWFMLHSKFANGIFSPQRLLYTFLSEGTSPVILGVMRWHEYFKEGTAFLWQMQKNKLNASFPTKEHLDAICHLGYKIGLKEVNFIFLDEILTSIEEMGLSEIIQMEEPLLRKQLSK